MAHEKIVVLDFGSQYAHLIAKRFRLMGFYSEIALPSSPLDALSGAKGIVFSGGPSSVYEENIPAFNPEILTLDVPILGYVEPLPGIPPTASHLRELTERFKGQKGVILFTDFQPGQGPEFLSRNLGWPKVRLGLEAGLNADAGAYFAMIDRWVAAVASAK